MAVTATDVTNRAKEFADLEDAEVERAITDAALQINRNVWGTKADLATIYLAAHLLSLANPSLVTVAGPVQSEKVGDVSRTYAVATVSAQGLAMSRWGQEYLRLRNSLPLHLVT